MHDEVRPTPSAAIAAVDIRGIRIHDLRHTFALHFMMRGGNILTLQRVPGHSTLAMTLRYVHFAPDFTRNEMQKVSLAVAGTL